jgi:hypothetical protein
MPRFTKQADCTPSAALAALAASTLSPLARLAAEPHLRSCDFCAAELRLHKRAAAQNETTTAMMTAMTTTMTTEPPPVPLALRLFAESKLAEAATLTCRAA